MRNGLNGVDKRTKMTFYLQPVVQNNANFGDAMASCMAPGCFNIYNGVHTSKLAKWRLEMWILWGKIFTRQEA